MKRNAHQQLQLLGLGAILVLSGSALLGFWQARQTSAEDSGHGRQVSLVGHTTEQAEHIEQALAQAGCPGWMVLASEGPTALGPEIVPVELRSPVNSIPSIRYPQPLRIATRPISPNTSPAAIAKPSSSEDPDDLLDGMPDLVWGNEEDTAVDTEVDTEESSEPEEIEETDDANAQGLQPLGVPGPALQTPTEQEPAVEPAQPTEPAKKEEITTPQPQVPLFKFPEPRSEKPTLPTPAPAPNPFAPPPIPNSAAESSTATSPTPASTSDRSSTCEFVADSQFPSAFTCAKCHEKQFEEWSLSSHAYAAVSPMFHKFEQKINDLSQGTIGYFCYRCHTPQGVSMGISRATPLWDLPQVAREGVTCVACHRVNQRYGKVNGERRIEPGGIFDPIYGPIGGSGVAETIARKSEFKVKTSPLETGPGQEIHTAGVCFDQLSKPEFCVSCHQVAVHPGIKLEVVWEQYRASPACKKGISCQDCHMGRIPGVPSGYEVGPAAVVNNKSVNENRRHGNHLFYGPGYSIAHPGVFPHNKDALRWSIQDWLMFDYRAGWGTEDFEKQVEDGLIRINFPSVWAEADDRFDARKIVEANLKKLNAKKLSRQQVMENGSHVDGPFFETRPQVGQDLRLHYVVTNTNEGHNMPSGSLGAQPQLWANVVLLGPRGQRLWESGYTDRWGDIADIHSVDVRNKVVPYDWQLFNLQTMFLITGAKGTDREFYLPVNFDIDQLPYIRPGAQPISVINHPPFIRMEGRSLAPLGSRKAPYRIPAELMREPGCYRLSFRMRMRIQPMYFMRFCDATIEMQRAMNEWITEFHQSSFEFEVE